MPSFCIALRLFFSLRLCLPRAPPSSPAAAGAAGAAGYRGQQPSSHTTAGANLLRFTATPGCRRFPHAAAIATPLLLPPLRVLCSCTHAAARTGLIQVRHVVVVAADLIIHLLLHVLLRRGKGAAQHRAAGQHLSLQKLAGSTRRAAADPPPPPPPRRQRLRLCARAPLGRRSRAPRSTPPIGRAPGCWGAVQGLGPGMPDGQGPAGPPGLRSTPEPDARAPPARRRARNVLHAVMLTTVSLRSSSATAAMVADPFASRHGQRAVRGGPQAMAGPWHRWQVSGRAPKPSSAQPPCTVTSKPFIGQLDTPPASRQRPAQSLAAFAGGCRPPRPSSHAIAAPGAHQTRACRPSRPRQAAFTCRLPPPPPAAAAAVPSRPLGTCSRRSGQAWRRARRTRTTRPCRRRARGPPPPSRAWATHRGRPGAHAGRLLVRCCSPAFLSSSPACLSQQ